MKQRESREKRTSTKLVWQVVVVMSLCLTFMGPSASQALILQTMKTAVVSTDDYGNFVKKLISNEPNDMTLEAFHDSGDVDCFEVKLPEYGTLTVFTSGDMDTTGSFEDEYSRLAWDDDGGEKGNFLITEPLKPGVYYLIVSGWDAKSVGSYYILDLEFTPDVISQGDDLNNSSLAINEYITIKDSPSDVGDASAYYVDENRMNSGPSSGMMYEDTQDGSAAGDDKKGDSAGSSATDSNDGSDTTIDRQQKLVMMAQTGIPAEALESGMTMPEIFNFAASMMSIGGDERLSDPKTWDKVGESGTEAVLTDTLRENIGIPEGALPGASFEELLEKLEDIQGLGGDSSDEKWWNDLVGALREKEGIPEGALPGASVEELLEGLGYIQGVDGDPSDKNIWEDIADVTSGDMSPEDFIDKWGSTGVEGHDQGSQDGGNTGSGTSSGSTSGTEAPYGDGQPIPGGTSGGSSDDGTGSDGTATGGSETPSDPGTPSDEGPDTDQDDGSYTYVIKYTDDGGFDATVCDWNGDCVSAHYKPDENGGFVNEETHEPAGSTDGGDGGRPDQGTYECTDTGEVDENGKPIIVCDLVSSDTNGSANSGSDSMPNPDDDECLGPNCKEIQLVAENPTPTNPETPVTDPDDPNDGVVNTTPRENIQFDLEDRLAPYINPGDTEGDPDESILPVDDPKIDQNHNPEPIDPQPLLLDNSAISETIAVPEGTGGSTTPEGSTMQ